MKGLDGFPIKNVGNDGGDDGGENGFSVINIEITEYVAISGFLR